MKPLKNIQIENDTLSGDRSSQSSPLPEAAVFVLTTLCIILFGLAVLYSTSFGTSGSTMFKKQIIWMGAGLIGFFVPVFLGYKKLSDWSPYLMVGVGLMLLTALFFAPVNGANRWIRLGPISLQPSEFAKPVLVLFLAKFLSERTRLIENAPFRKVFLSGALYSGPVIILVLLGRDLGTTVLLSALFLFMMFAAGMRLLYTLTPILIGAPSLFFLIKEFSPVRWSRITTFLNPEPVQAGEGYQLWLSFLALGSGNWFGVGFTESRLKQKYLPENHTDFILSIVGEEMGFVCLCLVIAAYFVFAITALMIACKARTRQGMLIAFGVLTFIILQAMINIGVITGAFPTKGMPAPFISYGGSNLVACMVAAGFVFSVALDSTYPDYQMELPSKIKASIRSFFSFILGSTPSDESTKK